MPNGHPLAFMEMAHQKMMSSNPKSSNPTRVASVVHPTSFLARRNACVSFRVGCKMFPNFKKTSQNRHETRRGCSKSTRHVSKGCLLDTRLPKGCLLDTPYRPTRHGSDTQWHDVFLDFSKKTRDHLWPTRHGNDTKWHAFWGNRRNMHILLWNTSLSVSLEP